MGVETGYEKHGAGLWLVVGQELCSCEKSDLGLRTGLLLGFLADLQYDLECQVKVTLEEAWLSRRLACEEEQMAAYFGWCFGEFGRVCPCGSALCSALLHHKKINL